MALQLTNIPLPGLGQRPKSLAELLQPTLENLQMSAHLSQAPLLQQLKQAEVSNIPLNRQMLEAKAKYASPMEQAKLNELLAGISHTQAETGAIPQRLQLEKLRQQLMVNQFNEDVRQHPQALINQMVELRKAQAGAANRKAGKGEEITGYDENGMPIIKRNDIPISAEENAFYQTGFGKGTRGKGDTFYNPLSGEAITALTPARKTQLQQQNYALQASIPLLQDLKEAGASGFLGAPSVFGNRVSEYQGKLASLIEHLQKAQLMGTSVAAMHKIENQFKRYPTETSSHYKKRIDSEINRFKNSYEKNSETLSRGGILLNKENAAPSFKTKEEEKAWFIKASPQEQNSYLEHRSKNG